MEDSDNSKNNEQIAVAQENAQSNYQKISEKLVVTKIYPPLARLVVGYVSQLLTIIAVIIYCVLLPSLYSTINLFFILIGLTATIAPSYRVKQIDFTSQEKYFFIPYPFERIVWGIFTTVNLIIIVIKTVMYFTNTLSDAPHSQLKFYEVENIVQVFVPIILIPLGIGCMLIQTNPKIVKNYKEFSQYKDHIKGPAILAFGILLLLIQMFTQSIVGMIFFFLIFGLFIEPNTDFLSLSTKTVVYLCFGVTVIAIVQNFNCTCDLILQTDLGLNWLQFYGINALNTFKSSPQAQGYYICLILMYLYSSFMMYLINRFQMSEIAKRIYPESTFSQVLRQQNVDFDPKDVQKFSDGPSIGMQGLSPQLRVSQHKQIQQSLLQGKDAGNSKVKQSKTFTNKRNVSIISLKQYQLPDVRKNKQFNLNRAEQFQQPQARKNRSHTQYLGSGNADKVSSSQQIPESKQLSKKTSQIAQTENRWDMKKQAEKFKKIVKDVFASILEFLTSAQFTLRVTELMSIVIIQRYNNVYSFVTVLWLACVSSIENVKIVWWLTTLILLPVQLGNYLILFFYNIPESPARQVVNQQIFGFEEMQQYWIDVLVFNVYLFWLTAFIYAGWRQTRRTFSTRTQRHKKITIWLLVRAFFFKYSYLLTLAALFALGFSDPTLINFAYVGLLLVFFAVGQRVVLQKKMHHDKEITTLTTFSRKFWFIIVYYTLICIVAKYTYFLFWPGQAYENLLPTGINWQYNWAFNFSLSSKCLSQTTPLFIIFILAQLQIIVYRSSIYIHHSFGLISQAGKIKNFRKHSDKYKSVINFFLQFYYQTLYYVSGFVILICSYQWSFIGLITIIVTGWGLLTGFSKKIIGFIVFLDLGYLFLGYSILFVAEYTVVQTFLGPDLTKVIEKAAQFIGFIINTDDLYALFSLNIVIFLFAVESYGLANILAQQRFQQNMQDQMKKQQAQRKINVQTQSGQCKQVQMDFQGRKLMIQQDIQSHIRDSFYETTVIESQTDQVKFAENYRKNVIQATQLSYSVNMPQKYKFVQIIAAFTTTFLTGFTLIIVIVCCIYFRLAVTMLFFLIVYLLYFWGLVSQATQLFRQKEFNQKIQRKINRFNMKQSLLLAKQKTEPQNMDEEVELGDYGNVQSNKKGIKLGYIIQQVKKEQSRSSKLSGSSKQSRNSVSQSSHTMQLIQFVQQTFNMVLQLKYKWKRRVFICSSILSMSCLVGTYCTQFINSEFYKQYIDTVELTTTLRDITFVIGIEVNPKYDIFAQFYFYYLMIFINCIEKMINYFTSWKKQQRDRQLQQQRRNREDIFIDNWSKHTQIKVQDLPVCETQFIDHIQIITHLVSSDQQYKSQLPHSNMLSPYDQNSSKIEREELLARTNQMFQEHHDENHKKTVLNLANLLIYFDYKHTQTKITITLGVFSLFLRMYILLMMINVYQKQNIFSFAYLLIVLIFWFRKLNFSMVKGINNAATVILVIQYLLLILDINSSTSPLPLPSNNNLSLLSLIITNPKWRDYLTMNEDDGTKSSALIEFIINALVIFLTQVYLFMFQIMVMVVLKTIENIYSRYRFLVKTLSRIPDQDKLYLNYDNFKHFPYRFLKLFKQLIIVNSYMIVSILVLIFLGFMHNYIGLVMLIAACTYIYMGLFTKVSSTPVIYSYTRIYFKVLRVIIFILLFCACIAQIPIFSDDVSNIYQRIAGFVQLSQIFMLFFIQIWLDLSYSKQFKQTTEYHYNKVKDRESVLLKCMAYQNNDDIINGLIYNYREILKLEVNIIQAMSIIKNWHQMMAKNMRRIAGNQPIKKAELNAKEIKVKQRTIQLMRQEIKQELARRPSDDEGLGDKLFKFMKSNTHIPLKLKYYDLMKFIVENNHRLLKKGSCQINLWDYILQNYDILREQIEISEKQLQKIAQQLNTKQDQQDLTQSRMQKLARIKQQRFKQVDMKLQDREGKIIALPKLKFPIKVKQESIVKEIFYFFMSNFNFLVTLFIWVYYMINPCLLSLPFVIYIFSYELMSYRRLTSYMLVYIFIIIVFAQTLMLTNVTDQIWIKYFFYSSTPGVYNYATGYLFFLFIMIFLHEQINKYRGTKFRNPEQVENLLQGGVRKLINQDENSASYLWKMQASDATEQEKDGNPMQYLSTKLENKIQQLLGYEEPGFFQQIKEYKVGIDLYPIIAVIQIFLTIYLIFFYSLMVADTYGNDLMNTLKYFQFSGDMVLAVLAHVLSIVIQRRITLMNTGGGRKQITKYVYTMIILALFLIFVYYIAPFNSKPIINVYQPPPALIAFSFFYFMYFLLSALQIRYGYKKYKALNSIMTRRRQTNNLLLIAYANIPFLVELKTLMDYSFCITSLKIFDWFRLFGIYYCAFKAKMQYYGATQVTLGTPLNWVFKLIGWLGFIGILLIIFAPMVLFSSINPIAQTNLVTGGTLQLGVQMKQGNYFTLYQTSHFARPPYSFNQTSFNTMQFGRVPILQGLSPNDISQQLQAVTFQPFSDNFWGISYPNFEFLTNQINSSLNQMSMNETPTNSFQLVVKYSLERQITSTVSTGTNFSYPLNQTTPGANYLNQTQLSQLYNSLTQCNFISQFDGFYIALLRLDTINNQYKPRPIIYSQVPGATPLYMMNVSLGLFCSPGINSTSNTNSVYWSLNTTVLDPSDPDSQLSFGMVLYVLCDKYQSLLGGLGFTAIYTSVILVVATWIRSAFDGNIPMIPYQQNPKPDNILQICQAIGTLRTRRQYRQEYLMYYQLIDIIRSPQIMKFLSGSYPVLIEEVSDKRRQKQIEKQKQEQMVKKKNE